MADDDWYEYKRGREGWGLDNWNNPSWERGHEQRQRDLWRQRADEDLRRQQDVKAYLDSTGYIREAYSAVVSLPEHVCPTMEHQVFIAPMKALPPNLQLQNLGH